MSVPPIQTNNSNSFGQNSPKKYSRGEFISTSALGVSAVALILSGRREIKWEGDTDNQINKSLKWGNINGNILDQKDLREHLVDLREIVDEHATYIDNTSKGFDLLAHKHNNFDLLETYTEANKDIKTAIEQSHVHANQSTLDNIPNSANAANNQYLQKVGSSLAWTNLADQDEIKDLQDTKADKTNVLELDNTTPFTPDQDYEPATKKYVDDEIADNTYWDRDDVNGVLSPETITDKIGVGTASATATLHSKGETDDNTAFGLKVDDSSDTKNLHVRNDGQVEFRNYVFPIADGSNGEALLTDGSGSLSFVDVATQAELNTHANSDGSSHTFIDQDVTSGSSPTFDGTNFSNIPDGALASGTTVVSAGSGDSGKFPKLDADGNIDASMINDGDISHLNIADIGTNTHAQIDTHVADATIHFAEGSIDHVNIQNIGTNTHTQIDTHLASTANPHSVTKDQVGLGNADNTSDLNKPISTATQTALNLKEDKVNKLTTFQATPDDTHYPSEKLVKDGLDTKLNTSDFSTNFDSNLATKTTDNLTEGSTNLYDKTVAITGGTNVTVGGTYPNFSITDNSASGSALTTHTSDTTNPHSVTATQVGLGNADNTSDLNKPISTATQTALNLKEDKVNKLTTFQATPDDTHYPSEKLVKDGLDTKLNTSDFSTNFDSNLATKTTDNLTEGSTNLYDKTVAITGGTNVTVGGTYPNFSITDNSASGSALTTHTSDTTNPHSVTATQVGLGNADNTSDLNKPISTATQTALNLKEDKANKGAVNGYASLDGTGKVPSTQLPSYVDDVLEYADFASLPGTGETGKIYITLDSNLTYRWSGSAYVELTDTTAIWGNITGTLSNQTDLQNALNAKEDNLTKGDLTEATSSVLTVTGGTSSVIGSGTSIEVKQSSGSQDGYLSSTDWTTFNNKQGALTFDSTPTDSSTNPVTSDGVFDSLALKENLSNKLTTFQATPDDTHYPSEKLVKDGLDTKLNTSDFSTNFDSNLATKTTDNLTEGSTNLYDKTVAITGGTNVTVGGTYPNFSITDNSASGSALTTHTSDTTNPHSVTATQVGLGNADNTSDLNKPISTATQTALNLKEDKVNKLTTFQATPDDTHYPSEKLVKDSLDNKQNTLTFDSTPTDSSTNPVTSDGVFDALATKEDKANKGVANGYASLDGTGKVPSTQLPSYVDDVLEYADFASLPGTGETAKIYVTLDTNKTYRWSGSAYVEVSPSEVTSVFGRTGAVTAQSNDYTWAQINKTVSDIADITTKSHTSLTDIGTNTHAQLDSHVASTSNPHSVTAGQVGAYTTTETDTLLSAKQSTLTFDSVPTNASTNPVTSDGVYDALALKENAITATSTTDYYRGDKTFQTLNGAAVVETYSPTNYTESASTTRGHIEGIDTKLGNLSSSIYWDRDSGNGYVYPGTLSDVIGVGTATPSATVHAKGSTANSGGFALKVHNSSDANLFSVRNDGEITGSQISTAKGMSVYLGYAAGSNDDGTNNQNTGIGNYAASSLTTGAQNIAIGSSSLRNATTSSYNTAIGNAALFLNSTTGNNNTAVGANALYNDTLGGGNVAVGKDSLLGNTVGSNNTAVGSTAGRYIANGSTANQVSSNSLYLGYNTKAQADGGTNEIVIGYDTTGNGSNTVTLGNSSITNVKTSGSLTLGAITIPNTDGTNGQVLQTNGSGALSWSNLAIPTSLWDADADTGIQVEESADEDIIRFDTAGTEQLIIDGSGRLSGVQIETNSGYSTFLGNGAGANDDGTNNGNVGVGFEALEENTTGYYNNAIGFGALNKNTSGGRNNAVGASSLNNNTTGYENNALGSNSLQFNTTGYDNNAVGYAALAKNTTGFYNNGFGGYALNANTTGSYNEAIGYAALTYITSGDYNTAIGSSAGQRIANGSNLTGADNGLFLGYNTRPLNDNSDNEIVIGVNAVGNGDNTTTIGNSSTIATYLKGELNLDNYKFPTADGTADQVLKTDGSGALSWASAGGSSNLITDADNDTKIQVEETADEDRIRFDTAGTERVVIDENGKTTFTGNVELPNTTNADQSGIVYKGATPFIHNFNYGNNGTVTPEGYNLFVGENAGNFTMGSTATNPSQSSYNVGLGYNSLSANAIGTENTAVGSHALESNTTGSWNVALGRKALFRNTSGNRSVAVGEAALYNNISGDDNVAVGKNAGLLTTSSNNTYLGYSAGSNVTTGTNNIIIGYSVSAPVATDSNQLSIGNLIFGTGLDATGTGISSGNIGVGLNAPTARTHIKGSTSDNSDFALKVDDSSDSPLFNLRNDGNIGVGKLVDSNNYLIDIDKDPTSSSASIVRINSDFTPSGTFGFLNGVEIRAKQVGGLTNPTLSALMGQSRGDGAANNQTVLGVQGSAIMQATGTTGSKISGGSFSAQNSNGSSDEVAGIKSTVFIQDTATDVYGYYSTLNHSGGTVANSYGAYIDQINGATTTNAYGLYIASVAGTNKWGLYENSGSDNYLSGNTGVGLNAPTARAHVKGATSDSSAYALKTVDSADTNLLSVRNDGLISFKNYSLPTADGTNGQVLQTNGLGTLAWASATASDHGALTGLSDDDHSQYALLAGRSGGQALTGGTAAVDDLTLSSTSNATKGDIFFGADSTYKESSTRLGIGTTAPGYTLHLNSDTGSANAAIQSEASNAAYMSLLNDNYHFRFVTNTEGFSILQAPSFTPRFNIDPTTGHVGIGTNSPAKRLDVNGDTNLGGAVFKSVVAKSADYTITDTDGSYTILVTTGATDKTINLPSSVNNTGRVIVIKKVDAGAGNVVINPTGGDTLDGSAIKTITAQYQSFTVQADGTVWYVI